MRYKVELNVSADILDRESGRYVRFIPNIQSSLISEKLLKHIQTQYPSNIVRVIDCLPEPPSVSAVPIESFILSVGQKKARKNKELNLGLSLNEKELKNILKEFKEVKKRGRKPKVALEKTKTQKDIDNELNEIFFVEYKVDEFNPQNGTECSTVIEPTEKESENKETTIISESIEEIYEYESNEYFKEIEKKEEEKKKKEEEKKEKLKKINIDELLDFFADDDLYNPDFNRLKSIIGE